MIQGSTPIAATASTSPHQIAALDLTKIPLGLGPVGAHLPQRACETIVDRPHHVDLIARTPNDSVVLPVDQLDHASSQRRRFRRRTNQTERVHAGHIDYVQTENGPQRVEHTLAETQLAETDQKPLLSSASRTAPSNNTRPWPLQPPVRETSRTQT